MKKKVLLMTLLLGTFSTLSFGEENSHKGKLSIIPKISFSQNIGENNFKKRNFEGLNADVIYGITSDLEVGANIGWVPYNIEIDRTDVDSYDKIFDVFSLLGTAKYSFNELNKLIPYLSVKVGWLLGDSEVRFNDGMVKEFDPRWQAGFSAGVEYQNLNLELGYQFSEIDGYLNKDIDKGTFQEEVIFMSLGYRFQ